jgi:guanylate kinase
MKKTNLFIISGPSGAGKDSVIRGLKKAIPIKQLITTASRPMRPRECQGNPYFFITKKEFIEKIKKGEFFEYDKHYGNYYGLTYEEIKKAKMAKKLYFWQAEYKGVITAKKKIPEVIAIFIKSPLKVLIQRMRKRERKINEKIFRQRIHDIEKWLKHLDVYDFIIDNKEGELDKTIIKVSKIIKKHSRCN